MKKKTVILVILAILVLSSITYAYSQRFHYPRNRTTWGRNRMTDHEFYRWEEDYRPSPRDYNRGYDRDSGDFRRDFRGHHRGFNRNHRNCKGW